MKLKLGNVILNQRALVKLFLITLIFGVMIGVKVAIRDERKELSLLPFLPGFTLLIVWLCRGVRKEIDSERL